jgi:hypothetical protein
MIGIRDRSGRLLQHFHVKYGLEHTSKRLAIDCFVLFLIGQIGVEPLHGEAREALIRAFEQHRDLGQGSSSGGEETAREARGNRSGAGLRDVR